MTIPMKTESGFNTSICSTPTKPQSGTNMNLGQVFASSMLVLAMGLPAVAQNRIQPPTLRPTEQPTTSPYLLLGPNSAIFQRELTYFNQSRNERRINAVNRDLRIESRRLDNTIKESQTPSVLLPTQPLQASDTGHSTQFLNTFNYFPQRRAR
jgi:hypothetical protein